MRQASLHVWSEKMEAHLTLAECKRELEQLGIVRYPMRIAYMKSFGPTSPDRRAPGHARRAAMSLVCAQRSLGFWRDDPGYARLRDDLSASIAFLVSDEPIESFNTRRDELGTVADVFLYRTEGTQQSKVSSLWSLLTAMTVCLEDFTYQDVHDERDAEVWAWDSAFHSATSFAGGAQWQAADVDLDLERRREFWTWFVEQEPDEAAALLSKSG